MKTYTVKEVAELAGVSVRTLHHYHDIGLLTPALIGENRYRYYGETELLRLQQILFYREFGLPLAEIADLLDQPGFDHVAALEAHREEMIREAERYRQLIRTIDRTIVQLTGDSAMKVEDLYKGFSPEKQAEYEEWLIANCDGDMAGHIADSKKSFAAMSVEEQAAAMAELAAVEKGLSQGLQHGIPADSATLDPLLSRHRSWVALMWGRDCPPEAYAGLAEMYLSHPDFRKRYETLAEGFTDYLTAAMKAYVARQAGEA
ncbi:MerR family transcriptional regulator [Pelagibius litoralis]|uniref:MerR family transcriptional regulator n=1 Tax=Pelagibius litoralis TaxID=374515 RepID=A0A967EXE9_9PROT|nr:MerR family transcriptional regulator [Pelagibius litoralis]NIA69182.1 MerR family transcriptional regulator [Pelagibius litoralis]